MCIVAGTDVHPEAAMDEEFRGLWVVRTSMQSQESIERVIRLSLIHISRRWSL